MNQTMNSFKREAFDGNFPNFNNKRNFQNQQSMNKDTIQQMLEHVIEKIGQLQTDQNGMLKRIMEIDETAQSSNRRIKSLEKMDDRVVDIRKLLGPLCDKIHDSANSLQKIQSSLIDETALLKLDKPNPIEKNIELDRKVAESAQSVLVEMRKVKEFFTDKSKSLSDFTNQVLIR